MRIYLNCPAIYQGHNEEQMSSVSKVSREEIEQSLKWIVCQPVLCWNIKEIGKSSVGTSDTSIVLSLYSSNSLGYVQNVETEQTRFFFTKVVPEAK